MPLIFPPFAPLPVAADTTGTNFPATPDRLGRPGFGLPVNFMPDTQFPNALTTWDASSIMVKERLMMDIMNALTDKPDWYRKVLDEEIAAKWKEEGMNMNALMTESAMDYCISELRDKAVSFAKTGQVAVLDSQAAVIKSDSAIPTSLREELKAAVIPLENVPEDQKDWHPNSKHKVLDLVHPSLYPLMYGKSYVLPTGKVGIDDCMASYDNVLIPRPSPTETDLGENHTYRIPSRRYVFFSSNYQWLPSEVSFIPDSDNVKITSYINNLHPQRYPELYSVVEKVISKTIPLWNETLSYLMANIRPRIPQKMTEYEWPNGQTRPRDEDESLYDDAFYERNDQWKRNNRILIIPEPGEYSPSRTEKVAGKVDLRRDFPQGIQVIVKLANIELKPGEDYEGGTWHIEGQLNEHICASAIYYYDQSNITESRLSFRTTTNHGDLLYVAYDQDDYDGVEELYGVRQGDPCLQNLGSVETRQGRLVVFPNVLQHRVEPFKLVDNTRPGYRKIVALFLVDPHIPILSTANVPPQRQDWYVEYLKEHGDNIRLNLLPTELMDEVLKSVEWPISLLEAKKVREDLMRERTVYDSKVNAVHENGLSSSFCEH